MGEITEAQVLEKVNNGEQLTPEEEEFIMGETHDKDSSGDTPEDDVSLTDEALEAPEEKEEEDEEYQDLDESSTPPKSDKQETPPEPEKKTDEAETGKAEEKPEEPEKTPEPEKKTDGIDLDKVISELEKPEGQQDISTYTDREKGLYWQMKNERIKRQRLEEENNTLKFRAIRDKAQKEVGEADTGDDDEVVTKADLKKIREQERAASDQMLNKTILGVWAREAKRTYPDFEEVSQIGEVLLQNNPAYQQEILAEAQRGGNPALRLYELTKTDPSFEQRFNLAFPDKVAKEKEAKEKKETKQAEESERKENARKFKENQKKPVTTGAKGGTGEAVPQGELSLEDIANMSDKDFAKLPKKKKEEMLRRLG